jgi:serine/threonine protein phosphatase 1
VGESIFQRILKKISGLGGQPASVPENQRVYAIGDIHGRADLLQTLHTMILDDAKTANQDVKKIVIYLGDYVDRGLESKAVIDILINGALPDFEAVYLKGNHEEQFLEFMEDSSAGPYWFKIGGDGTVYGYGVRVPNDVTPDERPEYIHEELQASVPKSHLDFLSRLELTKEIGDYFFVHAGINPGRPIDKQLPEDLLWIRNEFLDSEVNFGKVVVHGHSITNNLEILDNRICIDTGAYITNKLTCLVLEGSSTRFLSTK